MTQLCAEAGPSLPKASEGVGQRGQHRSRPLLEALSQGWRGACISVDRFGRDAIDLQTTARALLDKRISIYVRGLNHFAPGVCEPILAVLAQVVDMKRKRITERTLAGKGTAREQLERTGLTQGQSESEKASGGRC